MSVKFLSAILGPGMAAPILWTPGKKRPFCSKKPHAHKIPRFRGGGILGFGGPRGPSDSKFTIRSKFAMAIVKHYGGHSETTILKGN